MLSVLKNLFSKEEILSGNFGIEREGLRVDKNGILSTEDHPEVFGEKLKNPYITTDFSESQLELITPVLKSNKELYSFLSNLYNIVSQEIGDEYIWSQSMPCIIPNDEHINIAKYGSSLEEKEARAYREKLSKKYGKKKQLICGIHYNFSFNENIIKSLYDNYNNNLDYKLFKDSIYLKVTRNYIRYNWLIVYLLGATSVLHKSYIDKCSEKNNELDKDVFSNEGVISYRNSECCGYKNIVQLYPNYSSVEAYVESIKDFVSDNLIESHKELYSSIRLKAKDNINLLDSLLKDGINYLEYRSIDINPFDKGGISLEDLDFLQLFNIFLLVKEEEDYINWQEEAYENEKNIAAFGAGNVELIKNGKVTNKEEWAIEILNEIKNINNELNLGKEEVINNMISKVKDNKLTYAYRIKEKVKNEGYVEGFISLCEEYKKEGFNNRFNLLGYEDLELSTQILMKEAIKSGIEVEVIDRSENFIALRQGEKVEYVKQATKTSKDNYVSVLIMENKVVTKKVLEKSNIRVPMGFEFNSMEEAIRSMDKIIKMPIVVKPKSTNFGIGISIFPEGATEDYIIKALEIAFSSDKTVLVEEFIEGKEYRFLVIDNEVAGILHRVPANVVGDGIKTIEELVKDKNQDPLRGKGYRTPLEKINIDDNVKLFLKQSNKTKDYVPMKGEVVYLRENSNISTGGDSIDYTDDIPQRFKEIAVNCAKAVNANICGVDMMLKDYSDENSSYGIIELNFNPAIHIHCYPYKGKERKIAKNVLNLLGFKLTKKYS